MPKTLDLGAIKKKKAELTAEWEAVKKRTVQAQQVAEAGLGKMASLQGAYRAIQELEDVLTGKKPANRHERRATEALAKKATK